jgi:outer membrane protein assembly factor BamB
MKKSTLFATGMAAVLLAGGATSMAADWTQYRGPNHDGSSSEKLAVKKWPAKGPKVLWKQATPNGFSSFAVGGGNAYTVVGPGNGGGRREVAVALDAKTGKQKWRVELGSGDYEHDGGNSGARDNKGGDGPRSTPTYDNGKVYVLSARLLLICVDADTGKKIWNRDIMKQNAGVQIKWKNAASPLIDGDLLFVAGGGPGQAFMALNKNNGKVVWKGQNDLMTHSTPTVADIHGVRQVIFFSQTGLASLEAKSGKLLWRYGFQFKVSTAISPVVAGDIVYCSAGYGVGAGAAKISKNCSRFSAKEIYRQRGDKLLANHWSTPVLHEGHLYGMFQFKKYGSGPIKCVDVKTGDIKWEQEGFGPGNVVLVDGHLLALSDTGELFLIKATPAGYTEVAKAKVLSGKCWSTPVISGGRVYARSTTEAVCVDISASAVASR